MTTKPTESRALLADVKDCQQDKVRLEFASLAELEAARIKAEDALSTSEALVHDLSGLLAAANARAEEAEAKHKWVFEQHDGTRASINELGDYKKRAEAAEARCKQIGQELEVALARNQEAIEADRALTRALAVAETVEHIESAELAEAKKDAERGQWLIDNILASDLGCNDKPPGVIGYSIKSSLGDGDPFMWGESIQAAIDAAIEKERT